MKWPFVRRFKLEAVLNVNQVYLDEINRLNQELASELNSHRETKNHEQKLFVAHDKLNQQNMGLLFELEETKDALKIAQEDLRIYKGLVKSNKESIKYYLEKAINYL